jgi:hypothetical protein
LSAHFGAFDELEDLLLSPDGRVVMTGSSEGPARAFAGVDRTQLFVAPSAPGARTTPKCFSPDGSLVAVEEQATTVKVFSVPAGGLVMTAALSDEHLWDVVSVTISADNTLLWALGARRMATWQDPPFTPAYDFAEGSGGVYSVANGGILARWASARHAVFDGNTLVVGAGDSVIMWEDGEVRGEQFFLSHATLVAAADGLVAGMGARGALKVWDSETRELLFAADDLAGVQPTTQIHFNTTTIGGAHPLALEVARPPDWPPCSVHACLLGALGTSSSKKRAGETWSSRHRHPRQCSSPAVSGSPQRRAAVRSARCGSTL